MAARAWDRIKAILGALGRAQTFALLLLFYVFVLGPVALLARLAGRDFLRLRARGRDSFWVPRPPDEPTLERARHQS